MRDELEISDDSMTHGGRMNLSGIKGIFQQHGVIEVFVKPLAFTDSSQGQYYVGSGWDAVSLLPFHSAILDLNGTYKAAVDFFWCSDDGRVERAPHAQLVLYPSYPEVRLSGLIRGCSIAPAAVIGPRMDGRFLFLGVRPDDSVIGYAIAADSPAACEILATASSLTARGLFYVVSLTDSGAAKKELLSELTRINSLGWIKSKRLDSSGELVACEASNCGGYTLEAELGVLPNGRSEPDYLGWEIKQYGVANADRPSGGRLTLMTPEPTGGLYVSEGAEEFVRRFGYADAGNPNRLNFSSPHHFDQMNSRTGLTLGLEGFDLETFKITDPNGGITVRTGTGEEAARWGFPSLMEHWVRKHSLAAYVPCERLRGDERAYRYSRYVMLGEGTLFSLFLGSLAVDGVRWDPGIKLEHANQPGSRLHRRNQFRISANKLPSLYSHMETIDLIEHGAGGYCVLADDANGGFGTDGQVLS